MNKCKNCGKEVDPDIYLKSSDASIYYAVCPSCNWYATSRDLKAVKIHFKTHPRKAISVMPTLLNAFRLIHKGDIKKKRK